MHGIWAAFLWPQGEAVSCGSMCKAMQREEELEDTLSSLPRIVEVLRVQWDVGPSWRHGSIW